VARLPTDARVEIATVRTDPHRSLFGDRITPEDSTLATRGQGKGLWLYDELLRDPEVFSAIQKRKLALVGREWTVDPADDSAAAVAAADLVKAILTDLPANRLVSDLLDAVMKGIAIVELVWKPTDRGIVPVEAKPRDPRRFAFRSIEAGGYELRLLTRTNMIDGIPVPPMKFIAHRSGGRYDNPWGLGLGHQLFWPAWFKRQGVGFWLSAVEKFAMPTAVGKYPPGTAEPEVKKLLAALQALATDAGVAIPEGMAIELVEAKRAGAFDTYHQLATYMDEQIAKIVLGETLTSTGGESGSRALGTVHNEVRLEVSRADADLLSDTLNTTIVPWICALNAPGAPLPKLWWDFSEPEDLNARAERDVKVKSLGFAPTEEYIRETYGEGWEKAEPVVPPPVPGQRPGNDNAGTPSRERDGNPARAALAAAFAELGQPARTRSTMPKADAGDAADVLAAQLETLAEQAQDAIVERLRAIVDESADLSDLARRLTEAFPSLPTDQLAQLLGDAMSLAALQGRVDAAGV